MSLVGRVCILVYFGVQLGTVINRDNTTLNQSIIKRDLADPSVPPINLTTQNFNLAINAQYVGSNPTVLAHFNQSQIDRYFIVYA